MNLVVQQHPPHHSNFSKMFRSFYLFPYFEVFTQLLALSEKLWEFISSGFHSPPQGHSETCPKASPPLLLQCLRAHSTIRFQSTSFCLRACRSIILPTQRLYYSEMHGPRLFPDVLLGVQASNHALIVQVQKCLANPNCAVMWH